MADKKEVLAALELFYKNRPQRAFDEINKQKMGYMAVLMFLSEAKKEVNSIDISKALDISSARTAVLLKKLEGKEVVIKKHSKTDARAVIIELSEKGKCAVDKMKDHMFSTAEKLIEEMGFEELERVINGLNKINNILHASRPFNMEGLND